jgi:archaeosine synthase beta-subunit
MCDLWVHTLDQRVTVGSIPHQIADAIAALPPARQIKLYNAGSFFDPNAIPPEDDDAIARLIAGFDRVIVEAHPAFLSGPYGDRCLRLRDAIGGRLEVAIGLETADAAVLARLNKRMTIDSFARAAEFLSANDIDLRVFMLLKPPFVDDADVVDSACRSIDFARAHGAGVCSIIPTRPGNGAMPADFTPPSLTALEQVIDYGLRADSRMPIPDSFRLFADFWDVARLFDCACSPRRAERLREINRTQRLPPPVVCADGH